MMLRRIAMIGVAAALAAPVVACQPPPVTLFTCSVGPGLPGLNDFPFGVDLDPGLGHTRRTQAGTGAGNYTCSNHLLAQIRVDRTQSHEGYNSYPSRPLGCPEELGGAAGNNYPDNTPILVTPPQSNVSNAGYFQINWYDEAAPHAQVGFSRGPATIIAGTDSSHWRLLFTITEGKYAPPSGQTTTVKTLSSLTFHGSYNNNNNGTFTCANDSNPIQIVTTDRQSVLTATQQ